MKEVTNQLADWAHRWPHQAYHNTCPWDDKPLQADWNYCNRPQHQMMTLCYPSMLCKRDGPTQFKKLQVMYKHTGTYYKRWSFAERDKNYHLHKLQTRHPQIATCCTSWSSKVLASHQADHLLVRTSQWIVGTCTQVPSLPQILVHVQFTYYIFLFLKTKQSTGII